MREPHLTDHRTILRYGPMLDVDGLEVLFAHNWYQDAEQIAADLRPSGLRFPVVHAEKSIGPAMGSAQMEERALGLERLTINCRFGAQIGATRLVLHLWGRPGSDEHFERNLDMLDACLTIADNAGLELAVEAIPCDYADPLSNVHRAMEQDRRCLVALDTEFLALHQQLEESLAASWLWQDGRVRHVHIKDYDGQMAEPNGYRRYLHPGQGHIDFPGFFKGLEAQGFQGTISLEASGVQQDDRIDIARIQKSLAYLRALLER
jgi:sugar phosphate isomerase/epimerase